MVQERSTDHVQSLRPRVTLAKPGREQAEKNGAFHHSCLCKFYRRSLVTRNEKFERSVYRRLEMQRGESALGLLCASRVPAAAGG
jgi:hypothetical protein